MRTTPDIPDDLFKMTKLKAVQEGVALKVVVTRALAREVAAPAADLAARRGRAQRLFAALDNARNDSAVGPLIREELYDREMLRGQ